MCFGSGILSGVLHHHFQDQIGRQVLSCLGSRQRVFSGTGHIVVLRPVGQDTAYDPTDILGGGACVCAAFYHRRRLYYKQISR